MLKYLHTAVAYGSMAYQVFWVARKESGRILWEISRFLRQKGMHLTAPQIARIEFYTIQSCITTYWFTTLRGWGPTEKEKNLSLAVGALTPFMDDFSDHKKVSLIDFIENANPAGSAEEWVVDYLVQRVRSLCHAEFLTASDKMLEAQDESLRQLSTANLPDHELKKITFAKGGTAVLLYRLMLDNPLLPGERRLLYLLGYLLQLVNDQFDVYKDFHNGQQTQYTHSTNFCRNRHYFQALNTRVVFLFLKAGYERKNVRKFLRLLSTITSRGMVCGEQLCELQRRTAGTLNLGSLTRKELICDMEKFSNIRKSFQHSLQLYKLANHLNTSGRIFSERG